MNTHPVSIFATLQIITASIKTRLSEERSEKGKAPSTDNLLELSDLVEDQRAPLSCYEENGVL